LIVAVFSLTEPNILAHTAHSVSKKGVKKRDLNDTELRAIIAGFMSHIRYEKKRSTVEGHKD
jgi:hypothetical protein